MADSYFTIAKQETSKIFLMLSSNNRISHSHKTRFLFSFETIYFTALRYSFTFAIIQRFSSIGCLVLPASFNKALLYYVILSGPNQYNSLFLSHADLQFLKQLAVHTSFAYIPISLTLKFLTYENCRGKYETHVHHRK